MILMLAGLQNIPEEVDEAAKIDGATGIKKFFKITCPLLSPNQKNPSPGKKWWICRLSLINAGPALIKFVPLLFLVGQWAALNAHPMAPIPTGV